MRNGYYSAFHFSSVGFDQKLVDLCLAWLVLGTWSEIGTAETSIKLLMCHNSRSKVAKGLLMECTNEKTQAINSFNRWTRRISVERQLRTRRDL